ncbi:MAG: nitrate/nitrite transporter NrtS [Halieaceae bacterium]|uniref:nitrate/nitrite transporter NrtS n=1 Tax=Haliea alexandrii TaxID=2448162 RepID=UPI0018EE9A5C|nr:nitrate/nitrite transporter NrtS [Haliea alexandrii]MCR9184322.1 nitrate/nitrite transporter NrtS [Halieaceae bacterium]
MVKSTGTSFRDLLVMASARGTSLRALKLALVVGSLLTVINQGDILLQGQAPDWLKLVLTYLVPYGVSTWTSIAKDLESNTRRDT